MKRLFDFFFALMLLFFLSPLTLVIALLIKLTSRGPIIYWSDRVGLNNVLFKMPKFRTMIIETPALATHLMVESERYLTPIGSFLRQTSLDEIPQLWSVLIGQMSFVGPRPALFNQEDLIQLRTQSGIHHLKPGLTGWAQINGRDSHSISEKVEWERDYLNRKSFLFDFYIFIKTIIILILKKNISH